MGLAEGRYLVRTDGEPTEVLVCAVVGAPRARRRRSRRTRLRAVEGESEPEALPLSRLTVVVSEPLGDAGAAADWLQQLGGDPDAAEALVDRAVRVANRALNAHATAVQDPYLSELSAARAVTIRVGYGGGERVAEGRWDEIRELERREPRQRRAESLQPQERVAAVLSEHETVPPAETLLLRARLDLDQGRLREAALQLHLGLGALLAEPAADRPGDRDRTEELRGRREQVRRAAEQALSGELDPERAAELADTLARCERALRRRRLGGGLDSAPG